MKILVSGGAGFIGSIMLKRLIEAGHEPVALDDLSGGHRLAVADGVPFYEGDHGDSRLLDDIFRDEKIELVMHFAAKVDVAESVRNPAIYYRNNVEKTEILLDAMLRHNCRKLIFSSSAAVYGEPEYIPVDEDHPLNPINPYGKSKKEAENLLIDGCNSGDIQIIVFRYFNVAGAALDGSLGEARGVKLNLISTALENMENRRPTTIFGDDWNTSDGTCVRDYLHVEDIVNAHFKGIDYLIKADGCDVFNLGSGVGHSVREVLDEIVSISGRELKTATGQRREGDPETVIASNAKAARLLGWKPEHSDLETIIRTAVNWHFNRRY